MLTLGFLKITFFPLLQQEGCFGQVYRAEYNNTVIAVKTLKESASDRDRVDLLSELAVLKSLEPHPNVVRLVGCCTDGEH
jgi:receptor protein-tyrosine kinase